MPQIRNQSPPSYGTGIARSAAESANPGLWCGLHCAWVPGLGPTGDQIIDVVRGKHAALDAEMGFNTEWQPRNGMYHLFFDDSSTTDTATTPTINHGIGTGDFSFVAYLEVSSQPHAYSGIMANGSYAPGMYTQVTTNWGGYWGSPRASGSTLSLNQPYLLAMVRESGTLKFYQDGLETPTSHSVSTSMSDAEMKIGSSLADANQMDGWVGVVLLYTRALSESETVVLTNDPLALFRKRQEVLALSPVAPGGLSIPVAIHEYRQRQQSVV